MIYNNHRAQNRKTTKYIIPGIIVLFIIGLAGFLISWSGSGHEDENSQKKKGQQLKQLESYYEDGNYTQMHQYLEQIGEEGANYEKYRRIGMLNEQLEEQVEAIAGEPEAIRSQNKGIEDVAATISHVLEAMVGIKTWAEEGFIYGEKEGALYVLDQYRIAMRQYLLLSDEEINNAVNEYQQTGDCNVVAQIAIARVKGELQKENDVTDNEQNVSK